MLFAERSNEKEFMDDADFKGGDVNDSFRFIKLTNQFGGGRTAVISCIKKALRHIDQAREISLLDIGCGIGDMGNAIINWGRLNGRHISYTGLEKSKHIIDEAKKRVRSEKLSFVQADLFDSHIPQADLIVVSMVLHHLSDSEVVAAIAHLAKFARVAVLINELERSALSYMLCQVMTAGFCNHKTRHDALVSIKKGFTRCELHKLINQAGLSGEVRRALGWRVIAVIPIT